jgi:hypothetical protein
VSRLEDLDVAEVSLVPRAANKRKFLILKSEEVSMDEILKGILETDLENKDKVEKVLKDSGLSEEAANAVRAALKILVSYKDELPKDILATLGELAGYGYPAPGYGYPTQKAKEENKAEEDKKKYGYPAPTKKSDGSYDFSNVPEEVRPAIETLWKEHDVAVKKAAELEKALQEEKDKVARKEFIAKAAEFDNLSIKPEEFGLVLKAVAEKSPEDYAKLEAVLKAANESIKQSKIFSEIGSSRVSGGTAMSKIEAIAKTYIEKDAKVTKEQAIQKVLVEHPELYEEYLKEVS